MTRRYGFPAYGQSYRTMASTSSACIDLYWGVKGLTSTFLPCLFMMYACRPTTGILAWLSSSVRCSPSMSCISSSLSSDAAATSAKHRFGTMDSCCLHWHSCSNFPCSPGSHGFVLSGCNIPPLKDEDMAGRPHENFACLRMDWRVDGFLGAAAGGAGGRANYALTAF